MKKGILLILCFFAFGFVHGQSYKKTDFGIQFEIDTIEVGIQFFQPDIVRILKFPKDSVFQKESLSVIKDAEKVDFSLQEKDSMLSLKTEEMQVDISLRNGKISFKNLNGKELLSEKAAGFTKFDDAGEQTFSVSQSFSLEPEETIYGLGILQNGKMSQRDQEVKMIQGNTWDFVPFFQSVKGYGIFWDNYSPTTFSDNPERTRFTSDVGEGVDYYFMSGKNADAVITNMRELTGEVPMFPLWTYGYWQSRERYKSQEETVGVVQKYRDLEVPLDGIIQDWQYWGDNYHWNGMEFLNENFPDPQKMVDRIHNLNAHLIISIWSSFGPETEPYKELAENNMLFDFKTWPLSGKDTWPPDMDYPSGVQVYDAYDPKARDVYWEYLKKGLYSLGIDGWWMDSTEPDHLEFKPEDLDNSTYLGSFRKVRNAYPLMTVGGVYKHQRKETSDKRVFILTRSAFAGQQRYAANTWSGDVTASWQALKNQIPAGLNFSLTGIPYWNSDIGGFFLSEFEKKLEDPEYRELYTRWLQFGTFTPMMRSHGADAPREIYQFGQKGDKVYDAIEKFINLRYSLLPYIYSSAWDITHNNSSLMRALVMDFSNDEKVHDLNDQYMFGKSILVAPVTESMYTENKTENFNSMKSKEVYLPKGANWFDFWTEEKFDGGITIKKETPIDIIPLFVRAGSIIPVGPKVQYATEKSWKNLELKIYPGADGNFTLYEDEFDNYNYEHGAYSLIKFQWDDQKKQLTIQPREGEFGGMIKERSFDVQLIGEKDKSIKYNGEKLLISFK
jgi:alpha-D-xyloside xylohydrolase